MTESRFETNNVMLYNDDCFNVLEEFISNNIKIDMVLCDLPYNTTNAEFDKQPFDLGRMWKMLDRLIADNTPVVLFSQQPFTSLLTLSNIKNFRYEWIWEKTQGTGYLNAKKMPMKCHENILVFYKKLPLYNPQKTSGHSRKVSAAKHKEKLKQTDIYRAHTNHIDYDSTERYPRDVLKFKSDKQKCSIHSTQKPVALLEYLIKTYTNEGDTVIDFTAGSFSTTIASINTNRKSIGIEVDEKFYSDGLNRVKNRLFEIENSDILK